MARLYTNENVALPVVVHLRHLGHDVLTSHEAGRANQKVPDAEVLEYACQENRVLLTNNRRDFLALHHAGAPHHGLIVFTADSNFAALAERMNAALHEADLNTRFLVRITKETYSIEV